MAKIMIYEDDTISLIERYSKLNKNHEVYVHMMGPLSKYLNRGGLKNLLEGAEFDIEKVKSSFNSDWFENPPEADIYFTDGLEGKCFDILERLPTEKSFLYSGDVGLQKMAKEKGYQLMDGKIEEIIRKTLSE